MRTSKTGQWAVGILVFWASFDRTKISTKFCYFLSSTISSHIVAIEVGQGPTSTKDVFEMVRPVKTKEVETGFVYPTRK